MNVQCSGVSRSFAKETRVLKVRSIVAGIRSWQRPTESNHQSLSSYNNMRSCWGTQCQPLYSLHLKQIGKVKKLSKCCLMNWLKKKKKGCFEVLASLILCNNEPFLNWIVTFDEKWILYDNQWWPVQWQNWEVPQHFSKSNQRQKKIMVKVWWSAVRVVHYSFLNPGKTIYMRNMLSKSMRDTENCNACSPHGSTEWAQFSMTTLDHTSHNQYFGWLNWAKEFCLVLHIHLTSRQPTTTSSSLSNIFCRENASTTSSI